ncbi:MAG: alpha/beta fold hydrolase [Actinomycetota bacterium]
MPFVDVGDARLHVEVDGTGEPVTVLAHGLTNTCRELARLTPLIEGTKVRFCFRGHGQSTSPETGYRFADFARDLEAVASEYGATRAFGTSLGAGAICRILSENPDRFERLVFLLPAGLDRPFRHKEDFIKTAEILESKPRDEAIEAILGDPNRLETYARQPWMREFDRETWDHADMHALAAAIRGVIEDFPVPDRELMRKVQTPVLLICREGDPIHPAALGRTLVDLMPNAELLCYRDDVEMFEALPDIVQRVGAFLA